MTDKSSEYLRLKCPQCGKGLRIAKSMRGRTVKCPSCKGAIKIADDRSVTTEQTLLGKWIVRYNCPKCGVRLKSSLSDAGTQDHCADCGYVFIVPAEEKRIEVERAEALQKEHNSQVKERVKEQRLRDQQEKREAKQARREEEARSRRIEEQQRELQLRNQETAAQIAATRPVLCPYCHGEIPRNVEKCRHCGEFLVDTDHSDVAAFLLGFFLGPVGLWYKGHIGLGFAWLAFFIIFALGTGGFGICLAPFFWIGMAVHAATIPGKR